MGCSMPRTSALAWPVQTMPLAIVAWGFFRGLVAHRVPIGHGQAELRQHFLMRDRLVVLEPFIGLGNGFAFGIAQGVSILQRDDGFEQMNHGGERRSEEHTSELQSPMYLVRRLL